MQVKFCKKITTNCDDVLQTLGMLPTNRVIAIDGGKGNYVTAIKFNNTWVFTVIKGVKVTAPIVYLEIEINGTNISKAFLTENRWSNDKVVVTTLFAIGVSEPVAVDFYEEGEFTYGNQTVFINKEKKPFYFRAGAPQYEMLENYSVQQKNEKEVEESAKPSKLLSAILKK